jgi:hypothetical protein
MFDAARRLLTPAVTAPTVGRLEPDNSPPRLTPHILETSRMSRTRDRILTNLEEMYREAFTRAQTSGDDAQMATLDFAYRREQLYLEILLDIRDAVERR